MPKRIICGSRRGCWWTYEASFLSPTTFYYFFKCRKAHVHDRQQDMSFVPETFFFPLPSRLHCEKSFIRWHRNRWYVTTDKLAFMGDVANETVTGRRWRQMTPGMIIIIQSTFNTAMFGVVIFFYSVKVSLMASSFTTYVLKAIGFSAKYFFTFLKIKEMLLKILLPRFSALPRTRGEWQSFFLLFRERFLKKPYSTTTSIQPTRDI